MSEMSLWEQLAYAESPLKRVVEVARLITTEEDPTQERLDELTELAVEVEAGWRVLHDLVGTYRARVAQSGPAEPQPGDCDTARRARLEAWDELSIRLEQGITLMAELARGLEAYFPEGQPLTHGGVLLLSRLSCLLLKAAGLPRLLDELVGQAVRQAGPHLVVAALSQHRWGCFSEQPESADEDEDAE
jgi:hypothetical protein